MCTILNFDCSILKLNLVCDIVRSEKKIFIWVFLCFVSFAKYEHLSLTTLLPRKVERHWADV
jgi:hypothetical protein